MIFKYVFSLVNSISKILFSSEISAFVLHKTINFNNKIIIILLEVMFSILYLTPYCLFFNFPGRHNPHSWLSVHPPKCSWLPTT